MSGQKPDVTDEDIGMRAFQIRKERATERAAERMRRGLGREWDLLSQPEIELLGWAIGELWAFEDRADWENFYFSKLTGHDVREILGHARALRERSRNSVDVFNDIETVIRRHS